MSLQPHILVRAALGIVLLAVISHTRADPDLWGHVRFGGDILAERAIPAEDPYSFMSDRVWINHEWLAECAMYLAFAVGGGPGLALLKLLLVAGTLGIIWRALGGAGMTGAPRDLLLVLAVIGTFPQANHIRPQAFSLVAFASLVALLLRAPASPRWLAAVPMLFAAWANFHGGWIVGGGVLAIWTTCALAVPASRRDGVRLLVIGMLSLAATLVNPYGWNTWLFLWNTVGFGRAEITDWQPLYRLGAAYVAIWTVIALAAATGITRALRSGNWDPGRVAVVVLLGLASFQVNRLLAFFTIATVLCLGRELAAAVSAWRAPERTGATSPTAAATVVAVLMAVALASGGAVAVARNVSCVRMGEGDPEADVVPLVQAGRLQGRLAVWFDWGEYAIWHFAPALQVSIDGRRETVFSDSVMQKHLAFYYEPSSRNEFLSELRPDHIWLPRTLPVVPSLLADGWTALHSGPRSVWLMRPELDAGAEAPALQEAGVERGLRTAPVEERGLQPPRQPEPAAVERGLQPTPVERGLQPPRQSPTDVIPRCFPGP